MCEHTEHMIHEKYMSEFSKIDKLKTYSKASQQDNIKGREKVTLNSSGYLKVYFQISLFFLVFLNISYIKKLLLSFCPQNIKLCPLKQEVLFSMALFSSLSAHEISPSH